MIVLDILRDLKRRLRFSIKCTDNYFAVFVFHQVTPVFDPKCHNYGTWSQLESFKRQINLIKTHLQIISLSEGIELVEKNRIDGKYAAITFDDGDISIKKYVVPVLEKGDIPATFFLNSASLKGHKIDWYHVLQYLQNSHLKNKLKLEGVHNSLPILRRSSDKALYNQLREKVESLAYLIDVKDGLFVDEAFLRSLNSNLFHIGLHGHEHQRYSMMSREWQKADLTRNVDILSRYPSYKPVFAVPFGRPYDWDGNTIQLCRDNNIRLLFSDGYINYKISSGYNRIPADGREFSKELKYECIKKHVWK